MSYNNLIHNRGIANLVIVALPLLFNYGLLPAYAQKISGQIMNGTPVVIPIKQLPVATCCTPIVANPIPTKLPVATCCTPIVANPIPIKLPVATCCIPIVAGPITLIAYPGGSPNGPPRIPITITPIGIPPLPPVTCGLCGAGLPVKPIVLGPPICIGCGLPPAPPGYANPGVVAMPVKGILNSF